MNIILLEKVYNLGELGDQVSVKPGYARNFLLPQGKALRATKTNIDYFEAQRKELEKKNQAKRKEAEKMAKKLDGANVVIIRQAAESGRLYGSVSSRDIAEAIKSSTDITVDRSDVNLNQAIKELGLYDIDVQPHPEVTATISLNVARSEDEAKLQREKGGALIIEPGESVADAKKAMKKAEEPEPVENVEQLFEKEEGAETKAAETETEAEEEKSA